MSTKILFLDDMPGRVQILRKGEEIFYVRTPEEFSEWLIDNGTPDIISFDHDLSLIYYSGTGYGTSRPPDGADCARFCVDRGLIPKLVVVHSWNPDGAKRIAEVFNGCDCQVVVRMFNPLLFLPRVRQGKDL